MPVGIIEINQVGCGYLRAQIRHVVVFDNNGVVEEFAVESESMGIVPDNAR